MGHPGTEQLVRKWSGRGIMDDLGAEATKEALQAGGDILRRIAGPLADEVGESVGVLARHYRYRLALKMFRKTQQMLTEAGITPSAVPPRLFLPIIENASMQDDEDLHTRWAALLANAAAQADRVHPSYIEVLRQLSPRDAELLDKLYDSCVAKRGWRVEPWINTIGYSERQTCRAAGQDPEQSFNNLVRLGLIEKIYELDANKIKVLHARNLTSFKVDAGRALEGEDFLTDYAASFVLACRAPGISERK
jgi:hypothetical protein